MSNQYLTPLAIDLLFEAMGLSISSINSVIVVFKG